MLIVLEGLDAVGKSTQAIKLKNYFEALGKEVMVTHQPSGSSIGQSIKEILIKNHKRLCPNARWLLHCASHAQHWYEDILPALTENKVVIMDRFWFSAVAYSGYDGVDMSKILDLETTVSSFVVPDMIFYFTCDHPLTLEDELQDNSNSTWREGVHKIYERLYNSFSKTHPGMITKIDVTGKGVVDVWKIIEDTTKSKLLPKLQ